ncbi:MAG TPA: hypothetical protein VGG10_22695 [Rhizomicrobium sp.]|jgi:hypothetical protein
MTDVEKRREQRRERILRDINSLRIVGDCEAAFLPVVRIPAVAERLAYSLADGFSLLDLEAQIRNLFVQHPALRLSADEMRANGRGLTTPKADHSLADLQKLTADQRLAVGNERARLQRLEIARAKGNADEG